jgi:hypothetical protein
MMRWRTCEAIRRSDGARAVTFISLRRRTVRRRWSQVGREASSSAPGYPRFPAPYINFADQLSNGDCVRHPQGVISRPTFARTQSPHDKALLCHQTPDIMSCSGARSFHSTKHGPGVTYRLTTSGRTRGSREPVASGQKYQSTDGHSGRTGEPFCREFERVENAGVG